MSSPRSSPKRIRVSTTQQQPNLLSDELGKLVLEASQRLETAESFEDFVRLSQGPSDIHPEVEFLDHPASDLLREYRDNGVPFKTAADPWTREQLEAVLERGPHQSALEYKDFVREEFLDYVKKKYWILLPARKVMDVPELRLSPLGCVPQHERRPRLICDYTFYGVNQVTSHEAPPEAMQFGKALERVLYLLSRADPRLGPVYLSKIDISDGFYRLRLTLSSVAPLGILLPTWEAEEPLVAFPLVLPMGWTESPPSFCATTETVADLANWSLQAGHAAPFHRLVELAATLPLDYTPLEDAQVQGPLTPRSFLDKPVEYVDVYVDDIVGMAQGLQSRRLNVNRTILHSLDHVLRPLDTTVDKHRQEPASCSKLKKGDGCMTTQKTYLGWFIDTVAMVIRLTPRRLAHLREILDDLPRSRKRVSVTTWHKVMGELRSMALALPGSRGLFSALQFRFKADKKRIRLTTLVHDFLDDFRWIVANLAARPTRIYEVIPTEPLIIGATDASGWGMGGVFFWPTPNSTEDAPDYEAYVRRSPFSEDIRKRLVSWTNPHGSITNSDLELAATIAQNDVIAHTHGIAEATIANAHDNVAAMMWNRKGSATTAGPAAYLLRLQALHQRHYRYMSLHDFIPGHLNRLADDASRRLEWTDSELLTHFNHYFPQKRTWRVCHLRPAMSSCLTSALYKQRSRPELWQSELVPPISTGNCGWSSVPRTPWTLGSPKGTILYRTYKFSHEGSAMDASHPVATPFDLAQLLTSYEVSARAISGWGPETSA